MCLLLALMLVCGSALAVEGPGMRVSVRDVPVAQLLQRLMFDSGRQIVISGDINQKISVQLEGQSLDEAMQVIAQQTGLHVAKRGDIWVVSDQPTAEESGSTSATALNSAVVIPPPPPAAAAASGSPSVDGKPLKYEKIVLKFADVYEIARLLGAYVPETPWEKMQLESGRWPAAVPGGGYGGAESASAGTAAGPSNPFNPVTGGYHQRRAGGGLGGGAYGAQQYGGGAGMYGGGLGGGAYGGVYGGGGVGGRLDGIAAIVPFPPENALVVQGTQEGIDRLRELLALFDTQPTLLEVTVQLVEIRVDSSDQLGLSWSPLSSPTTEMTFGTVAPQPGIGVTTIRYAKGDFWVRLGALLSGGRARIVQSPRIVCKSSPTIMPSVFVNTPQVAWIPETSYTQFGTPVVVYTPETINIPISLSLYPRVNGDGTINVILYPTFTEFAGYSPPPPGGGAGVPLTITRQITADFNIANGDTVIIGGVVRRNDTSTWYEVPLLSELPVIGPLFRSKSTTHAENELVILVTPRILHTPTSVL